ncbi:MAG: hypothetical protein ACLTR8_07480 [Oscillospiraceae bacterium]|uniref:hypothetical protein n=1 Tax=Neglectibacter timonensis TaxID=1776382 RepID=UPI00266C5740|nr:hypothetical protein [Neglectibacter timonensis]
MKETTDMRENWLRLINQMLKQADTLTVRQAYYLLLGFIGKKTVSNLGAENIT